MTLQDQKLSAGGALRVEGRSTAVAGRSARTRLARAAMSRVMVASALLVGLGAEVHARDLSRSEVEAISRSEARREYQRREMTGQNVPTDLMQVGPQGRPTTVNGNGTTVTRNR